MYLVNLGEHVIIRYANNPHHQSSSPLNNGSLHKKNRQVEYTNRQTMRQVRHLIIQANGDSFLNTQNSLHIHFPNRMTYNIFLLSQSTHTHTRMQTESCQRRHLKWQWSIRHWHLHMLIHCLPTCKVHCLLKLRRGALCSANLEVFIPLWNIYASLYFIYKVYIHYSLSYLVTQQIFLGIWWIIEWRRYILSKLFKTRGHR